MAFVSAARGYRKTCSSATISTTSHASAPLRWSLYVGKHLSSKETGFRTQINLALAEENIDGIYQAWCKWSGRGFGEVPLDNRELSQLRRAAARIVCDALRAAVCGGDAGSVSDTLRAAEAVASRFPYAIGVRASREYAEAACVHREAEKAGNDDASTAAGSDRQECESPQLSSPKEDEEEIGQSVAQHSEEASREGAAEINEAHAPEECEASEEHGGQAELDEEKQAEEDGQEWQEEELEEQGEEEWQEQWEEEECQEEWEEEEWQEEWEEEECEEEEVEVPEEEQEQVEEEEDFESF